MAIAITAASGSVLTRNSAITMQGPLTISAWVFLTTAPGAGSAIYTCYLEDTGAVNTPNILLTYDGGFECRVNVGGTQLLAGGGAQSTGSWYHICGVIEGTSSTFTAASIYQGGQLLQRVTGSISVPTAVTPKTYIGNHGSGGTFGTQNDPIAEVAIWNTLLTANEIQGLAVGIAPNNFEKSNLISWVSLNSNSGTITDHIAGSWTISSSTGITTSADPDIATAVPSDINQLSANINHASGVTTVATTFAKAQNAGNTNAAFVAYFTPGVVTATASDTANGAYTAVGPVVTTAGGIGGYIFYKQNIASSAAGANALTVTFSGGIGFPACFAAEVSGVKTASFDVSATAKTTTQTGNGSIAITTSNPADKILTGLWQNVGGGWTAPGSGFQEFLNDPGGGFICDFQKVTSAGTYTDTPTPTNTNTEWFALALALQTQPVGGGPLYIQGNKNAASGTTVQTSYTNAQTLGNTNLVAVLTANSTQPTVADTKLNTYSLVSSGNFAAQGIYLWLFGATNIAAAGANANTVTATTTTSQAYNGITVLEYFGVSLTKDGSTVGNGFGTVWTAPVINTTNSNDLVLSIGLGSSGGTVAAGTDSLGGTYTMRQTPGGTALAPSCEDQIVSVTGSFFGTMTGSSQQQWCVLLTALQAATPPGQVTPVISGSIGVTGSAKPNGPVIANQSGSILVTGKSNIGQPVVAPNAQIVLTGAATPSLNVLSLAISGSLGISQATVTQTLPTLFEVISGSLGISTATLTPLINPPLLETASGLMGISAATVTPTIATLSETAIGNWTVRGAATPTIPILSIQIFGNWAIAQTITPTLFPPFVISGSLGVTTGTQAFIPIGIAYPASGSWGLTANVTPFLLTFTASGSWGLTGGVRLSGSLATGGISGDLISYFDFWGGGFC